MVGTIAGIIVGLIVFAAVVFIGLIAVLVLQAMVTVLLGSCGVTVKAFGCKLPKPSRHEYVDRSFKHEVTDIELAERQDTENQRLRNQNCLLKFGFMLFGIDLLFDVFWDDE